MFASIRNLKLYFIILSLSVLIHVPIMWVAAAQNRPDYKTHEWLFTRMKRGEHTPISHVLYPSVLAAYASITSRSTVPLPYISFAAVLTFMLPTPLVILAFLKRTAQAQISDPALVAMSLGLTIVAPISIWLNQFMLGYLNPIVYHNPTFIALRLFAIPVSWFVLRAFSPCQDETSTKRFQILLLCAGLILVSTMAKPSYLIALIPSCCIFAIWQRLRLQSVDWILLIGGILLPGLPLLALQYSSVYVHSQDGSYVAIGFLRFFEHYVPLAQIPLRFLLSLVFPIGVTVLYFNEARKHLNLQLSWVVFGSGAFIAYFFYEAGRREQHGNFVWTGYIVTFVLMYAALSFLIEQIALERKAASQRGPWGLPESRRARGALLLFGLHVLFGSLYYFYFMMFPP